VDLLLARGQRPRRKGKEACSTGPSHSSSTPNSPTPTTSAGSRALKLEHIKESIADFDKYLELKPEQTPGH